MQFLLFICFAYFLGSIPFGKIIGHMQGIDVQKKGSGNIGFTNSLRALGWRPAVLVLIGDILKGFIPTKIALEFLPLDQALIIAAVAILAHIFPIWLKFKGGKGVATGLGSLLAINPLIIVIAFIVFLAVFLTTKIVSISSILSTYTLPIIAYFIFPKLIIFYLVLSIIVTWTHRENLARLTKGTEKRIM
ncbi:MAG: glycerol-3-phosphate 1-O-acyltransferase PlsY [Patescibacteria group bacterium]